MSDRCKMPDGISIMPDGAHELDPCIYDVVDECVTPNCGYQIRILRCSVCGNIEIEWARPGNPF